MPITVRFVKLPTNTTHNPVPITHNQIGLSLVEVLVAIAIVSIVTIVAIPNLNNFNDNQDFINQTNQFRDILQKAQSSSRSGIRCSNNGASQRWNVVVQPTGYFIRINCENGVNESQDAVTFPSDMVVNNGCSTNDLIITLTNSITSFACSNGTTLTAPITIGLAQGDQSRNIVINSAGVVSN